MFDHESVDTPETVSEVPTASDSPIAATPAQAAASVAKYESPDKDTCQGFMAAAIGWPTGKAGDVFDELTDDQRERVAAACSAGQMGPIKNVVKEYYQDKADG